MKEICEAINAEIVNEDCLVINSSKQRELSFELTFAFVLLLPLAWMLVSYNTMDITGLLFTCFMIGLVVALHFHKGNLCYKTIIFNRKLGEIKIKQGFPSIDETIKSSEVVFNEFSSRIKSDAYDNLVLEHNNKRYRVFEVTVGAVPYGFLQDYMKLPCQTESGVVERIDREPDSEMYDPSVHIGWTEVRYSNTNGTPYANIDLYYDFEDGRKIYLKTNAEGYTHEPPEPEKYSITFIDVRRKFF